MKSIFILAALLLSFQVKSQSAQLNSWELSDLSPFTYQNVQAADLSLSLENVALHLMTERGLLNIEAEILYTETNNCGAKVVVASTNSGEEIVVTDFTNSRCAELLKGQGRLMVEYKVFERKSLHPTVDVFYASSFKDSSDIKVTNTTLEQIENRENLALRRLDARLRVR